MKIVRFGLCIILLSQTIACSAFRSSTMPVKFTCEPKEGVALVVNGQQHNCPATIEAPRNRELSVEGYKDGYIPYKRTISYHRNDTFILDLIGTFIFLVPVIGLMMPGSRDLDETDVLVTLPQK
jgi:hypothetical protein